MNIKLSVTLVLVLMVGTVAFFSLRQTENTAPDGNDTQASDTRLLTTTAQNSSLNNPKSSTAIKSNIDKKAVTDNQQPLNDLEEKRKAYQLELFERLSNKHQRTSLEEQLIQNMLENNRYPPNTRRFAEPEADPVRRIYQQEFRSHESEDGAISLNIWSEKNYYQAGEAVRLFAFVRDEKSSASGKEIKMESEMRGILSFNNSEPLFDIHFSDSNGDLIYEAELGDTEDLQAGMYKILVYTDRDLKESVIFSLSEPFGEFTGSYRDSIVNGNLIIDAEVDLAAAGFFQIQASLYNESDSPVGNVEIAQQLEAGKQWVQIPFYGKMLRDQGVDAGHYLVKNLSLAKRAFPVKRSGLISPNYQTEYYQRNQFNDEEYNPLLRKK